MHGGGVHVAGGFQSAEVGAEYEKDRGFLHPRLGSGQLGDRLALGRVPDLNHRVGLNKMGGCRALGRRDDRFQGGFIHRAVAELADGAMGAHQIDGGVHDLLAFGWGCGVGHRRRRRPGDPGQAFGRRIVHAAQVQIPLGKGDFDIFKAEAAVDLADQGALDNAAFVEIGDPDP
ncbi:hypothetical protein DESC_740042 [Desulfosarcina cetonica]|nr:hypothetical protein DESC_740042 [Desulfosarcina cetonica]